MDHRGTSYISSDTRPTFDVDMVYIAQQRRDSLRAPLMDRASGSSSSMGTDRSYQSMNSALSPITSYAGSPASEDEPAFPQTSSDFRQNSFLSPVSPTSPTSPTWPRAASPTQETNDMLPLFNIENDGDPRINPDMYYDFKVDKKDSFLELKPGYLVTPKFPRRKKIDSIKSKSGKKEHVCRVPLCNANPFTRHYDLERHFKSMHAEKEDMHCDYRKCPHEDPFRKDHGREHYREYHMEDLVKRKDPLVQDFLSKRVERVNQVWWRCTRCLRRVTIRDHGYKCYDCNRPCEVERVELRKSLASEQKPEAYLSGCGKCENFWVPGPSQWVPCPLCRPEAGSAGS